MAFARFFYFESEQDRICKYINGISKKNIEEEIKMNNFPCAFGREFIIGPETHRTDCLNENRYYLLHYMDSVTHTEICERTIFKGILEVKKNGQLIILDDDFTSWFSHSQFIFENRELKLHTRVWLENRDKARKDAFIKGCMGAVAVAAAVGIAAYKMG